MRFLSSPLCTYIYIYIHTHIHKGHVDFDRRTSAHGSPDFVSTLSTPEPLVVPRIRRFFVPSPKFRAALITLVRENRAQRFWTQDGQMRWSSHQASEDPSVTPNKHANPPQGVAEEGLLRQQDDNRDGGCSVLKLSLPGAPLLKCPTSCSRPEALNLKA